MVKGVTANNVTNTPGASDDQFQLNLDGQQIKTANCWKQLQGMFEDSFSEHKWLFRGLQPAVPPPALQQRSADH